MKSIFFLIAMCALVSTALSQSAPQNAPPASDQGPKKLKEYPAIYSEDEKKIDSFIESRDLNSLLQFSAEVELKYSATIHSYAVLTAKIAGALSTYNFGDNKQYLYPDILVRRVLDRNEELSFDLHMELVSQLRGEFKYTFGLVDRKEWPKDRKERVDYLKRFVDRVENRIDDNFSVSAPEYRFIAYLPVPGGGYPAGVDPSEIKEADLRIRYEREFTANRERGIRRTEQFTLMRIRADLDKLVDTFLTRLYSNPPYDNKELAQYISIFGITGERSKKITDAVLEAQKEP